VTACRVSHWHQQVPAAAAAKIGLNIAYSFWLGFLQACDSRPWSGRITPFARPGQGLFVFRSYPPAAHSRRAALQGNPSAFARDSSAFERVDFLNERQAMTRTFSDIDDIGGTPHLVENRFRLNSAAAILEIIHTQEFPVRHFEGKQKNSVFCIRRHFHSC
jgi:hypothetical protein